MYNATYLARALYVVQSEIAHQSSNKMKKESEVHVGGKLRPKIVVSSNLQRAINVIASFDSLITG